MTSTSVSLSAMLRPTALRPKTLPLSLEAAEDGKLRRTVWVGTDTGHVTATARARLSRIRRQTSSAQIESCLFFQYLLPFPSFLNLHEFKNCFVYFFQEIMFLFFKCLLQSFKLVCLI